MLISNSFATTSGLATLSARASAIQSGAVTRVAAVTFGPANVHYATEIGFAPVGYAAALPEPKSAMDLMEDQLRQVVNTLRDGLNAAAEEVLSSWRHAIASGEAAGDVDIDIHGLRRLADSDAPLPSAVRDMIGAWSQADASFQKIVGQSLRIHSQILKKREDFIETELPMLIHQAIVDQVDAKLAARTVRAEGLQGAEVAIILIRNLRDDADAGGQRHLVIEGAVDAARTAGLMAERQEMIDEMHRQIDNHEIPFSVTMRSAWGRPDIAVGVAAGHTSSVYVSHGYHMAAASVSADLATGQLIAARL